MKSAVFKRQNNLTKNFHGNLNDLNFLKKIPLKSHNEAFLIDLIRIIINFIRIPILVNFIRPALER